MTIPLSQFVKRPGAVLENGSVIAHMSLDDPSQAQRLELYQGPGFPATLDERTPVTAVVVPSGGNVGSRAFGSYSPTNPGSSPVVVTLSPHHGYEVTKKAIENALDGYCIPDEKKFKGAMQKIVGDFLTYAFDPRLPLDEIREVMATIRGRIPPKLEKAIVRYAR